MKNKSGLLISLLLLVILVLGFLYYRSQKQLDELIARVQLQTDSFSIRPFEYDPMIDDLKKLKSDTLDADQKENFYQFLRKYEERGTGLRLFVLSANLHGNRENQDYLNQQKEAFGLQLSRLGEFYILHEHFPDLKPGDLDTLMGYYQHMKQVTENVERLKLAP